MKNKILILGLAMLLSVGSAFAQGGTFFGKFTWVIQDSTLFVSGEGDMPNLYPKFDGWAPWFDYSESITAIIIGDGITRIGHYNFNCLYYATSVTIPNGVTSIGNEAFYGCGITSISFPSSITSIGEFAFMYSKLASVTLQSGVTSIESGAFGNCINLISLTNYNPVPIVINPYVFYSVDKSACTLCVPINSVSAYKKTEVWKEFKIKGVEVDIDEMPQKTGNSGQLIIYPNPATGTCSVVIPDDFLYERSLALFVYDASGKLIQQIRIDNDNLEKFQLKLDNKEQEAYVVTLSSERKSYSGKVVFN
jgi:hypothetical protein